MAELTEEQKIIIGVCVGVAALILIAIIVFICCTFYRKDRYRYYRDTRREKRFFFKDRPDYEYEKRPYTIYEDKYRPPPFEPMVEPLPLPPPLPPPEPRREIIYTRPRPIETPMIRYKYDYDNYSEPAPRYPSRYESDRYYKNEPIVVSLAEPEYTYTPPRREAETIYLKYNDDQALLRQTNVRRRIVPLRRSKSAYDIRRSTPYVGEWQRREDDIDDFNEGALRAGRDPFLWKSRR